MPKLIDLSGSKFGRWKVLGAAPKRRGKVHWRCACACGRTSDVDAQLLRERRSTQCRVCQARASARSPAHREARARLNLHVWPKTCAGCGMDFLGTAKQRRCRPGCNG